MTEKPQFQIIERIGHGQFSQVYKARWVNAHVCAAALKGQHNVSETGAPSTFPQRPASLSQTSPSADLLARAQTRGQQSRLSLDETGARAMDKYVALKRIKFYDVQNSAARMDCIKEVELLQQLEHPNIINYYVSFIERQELFIVLELADGGDLSKLIRYFQRRNQLINETIILKYFTQVCSAVQYIHSKRILHRDIKPANIFMTSDGRVKLGDFGLGRFFSQNTRDAHSLVGTFYYMSPERIRESGYDFSSDVWSLGCVLYELITLNSPFSIMNIDHNRNKELKRQNDAQTRAITDGEAPAQQQQLPLQCQTYCNHNNQNDLRPQQQQQQPTQTAPSTQPPAEPHIQRNNDHKPYNLEWLIDRICRADYPSLAKYTHIDARLRILAAECLQTNPQARPNLDYICRVVNKAGG